MSGLKRVIGSITPSGRRSPRGGAYVFALPYLADYRRAFIDRLADRVDGDLVLVHPRSPLNPTTRVIEHELSMFSSPVRRIMGFESQRHLVRNVAALDPKAIVVEANVRDLTYIRLLIWARFAGVPVAIWGLGRYSRESRSLLESLAGRAMTTALVALSSRVIGKGAGPAEYYRKFTGNPSKVVVAPNSSGIEDRLECIARSVPDVFTLDRPMVVLFVGRLTPPKDLDLLIHGMAVMRNGGACRLEIVGEGPEMDRLRDLAERNGLGERVVFFGNLEGDDLVERFERADVLALPGKGGLVVPEALAAGLPLVVGPLNHAGDGTLGEVIRDGLNAVVAAERSAQAQANAMDSIFSALGEGRFGEMQAAARESYSQHGGVAAMTDVFDAFLRQARA